MRFGFILIILSDDPQNFFKLKMLKKRIPEAEGIDLLSGLFMPDY